MSKTHKKYLLFCLIVVFIWGLAPLLWFSKGMIVTSSDMRLPLTLEQFNLTWYGWNNLYNTGVNYNVQFTALTFFGLQAFLRLLNLSVISIQKIQFIIWFMLPGFSMFYMMSQLLNSKNKYLASLVAVGFYMFNLYLDPIWLGFNMANLALYAVLPFVVVVFLKGLQRKYSILKAATFISLASLIASASGANPPLLVAVVPILFLSFFIYAIKEKIFSKSEGRKFFFKYLFFVLSPVVLINSFWLLPRIGEVFYSVSDSGFSFLSKDDALQWLQGISANSSICNIVRFQGIWTWSQGWQEPYCPYAIVFRENLFFIILSWLLPLLVLCGLFLRKNSYKIFFIPLTILGLIFSMGAHAPFGSLYLWCVNHIPFFWIVRSPWYKFTLLTCLGYAFFIGLAAERFCEFIENRKWQKTILIKRSLIAVLILLNMVYAYPVVFGKFFVSPETRKFLPPNHAVIPEYVTKFSDYINSKDEYFRIMDLPDNQIWAYSWGLSGPTPFVTQVSLKPVLFNIYTQLAGSQSKDVTSAFYDVLYNKGFPADKLLNMLNAGYVLQENDVSYTFPDNGTDSPEFVLERLSRQNEITLEKKFGNWDLYKANVDLPYVYTKDKATLVKGTLGALPALTNTNLLDEPLLLFESSLNSDLLSSFIEKNLIDEVVYYNYDFQTTNNNFEYIQDNFLNYYIFLDSSQMNINFINKVDSEQEKIAITYNKGFYDETISLDGQDTWYLLKLNNGGHIVLNNSSTSPQRVNLAFTAHSFGRDRNLYVYINSEYINNFPVAVDENKGIVLENILLSPGENIIDFGSMATGDEYEGKIVSFGIKDDAVFGKFSFDKSINLPVDTKYCIRVYPYPLETYDTLAKEYIISINGLDIKLKKNKVHNTIVYSANTNLKSGLQTVKIEQVNSGEDYIIGIYPANRRESSSAVAKVDYKKINPTQYTVSLSRAGSYFLVFNESYHSQWDLIEGSGAELNNHFIANGYANGWYVNEISNQELSIKYRPQNLFIKGCIVSIVSFCTLLCLFVVVSITRRKHEID
jgi:hypothetical protein